MRSSRQNKLLGKRPRDVIQNEKKVILLAALCVSRFRYLSFLIFHFFFTHGSA